MEAALVVLARKAAFDPEAEAKAWVRYDDIPFASELRYMATLHDAGEGNHVVYVKGAPECLLEMCNKELYGDALRDLDAERWQAQADEMGDRGQRLLAVAGEDVGEISELTQKEVEHDLVFIGLFGLLPELLDQIPADVEIASVTADGAYDTRRCHDAVADRGAHAVIPPRKNAKPWKSSTAGAIARNEAPRASKYLGRAIWRKWSGYHRRSRAETKMHCVKLLGQSLMARDFDRQVAELQIRAAVLKGYTALGIPVTEPVG